MSDELSYPTGKWIKVPNIDAAARSVLIDQMASQPVALREAVAGLTDAQLDTPYRPGGWTVRQVVHHLADAHMNAFIRVKLAFTEDNPTIKPYDDNPWAETVEAREAPIASSLSIIDGLHARWVHLLRSLDATAFERTVMHPVRGPMSIDSMTQLYSWHGKHHTAHITRLRDRMGW